MQGDGVPFQQETPRRSRGSDVDHQSQGRVVLRQSR